MALLAGIARPRALPALRPQAWASPDIGGTWMRMGTARPANRSLFTGEAGMTGTPDPWPSSSAFYEAVDAYGRAFTRAGAPYLLGVRPEDMPLATAVLRDAVAQGRPVGWWGLMRTLGYPNPPPDGANY
jgi:hypothetical protein